MTLNELLHDKIPGIRCILETPFHKRRCEAQTGDVPSKRAIVNTGTGKSALGKTVRVASWNAFEGNHSEAFRNGMETLLAKADIILLQEAPHPSRAEYGDTIKGLHYLFAPDTYRTPYPSGNIIISKHPCEGTVTDLPIVSWEYLKDVPIRRNALHARFGELTITNAHLDIFTMPHYRSLQFAPALRKTPGKAVLGMDANALYGIVDKRLEPVLTDIERRGFVDTITERPRLMFADYMFSRYVRIEEASFVELPGMEWGHKPIIAQFSLPK